MEAVNAGLAWFDKKKREITRGLSEQYADQGLFGILKDYSKGAVGSAADTVDQMVAANPITSTLRTLSGVMPLKKAAEEVLETPDNAAVESGEFIGFPNPAELAKKGGAKLGMIAGIKTPMADFDALKQAAKMLQSGKYTPQEVKEATGWYKDRMGDFKWEFSDEGAEWIGRTDRYAGRGKVGDFLKHDKLYQAYPDVKDMRMEWSKDPYRSGTYFFGRDSIESKGPGPDELLSNVLHEVQHGIQMPKRENFAIGGDPIDISIQLDLAPGNSGYEAALKQLRKSNDPNTLNVVYWAEQNFRNPKATTDDIVKVKSAIANLMYYHTLGEVDARTVQHSMGKSEKQLRQSLPEDRYGLIEHPVDPAAVTGQKYGGQAKDRGIIQPSFDEIRAVQRSRGAPPQGSVMEPGRNAMLEALRRLMAR